MKKKDSFSRRAQQIVVLGAGVMGSRIACHFAHVGCQVLLLDQDAALAEKALKTALDMQPSPIYSKTFLQNIQCGGFQILEAGAVLNEKEQKNKDFFQKADWIIEVIIENLAIKQTLFEKVEKLAKKEAIISSNTSGIPLKAIAQGRSADFQKRFLGTHFFNPPRYLPLLEIIPTTATDPEIVAYVRYFGSQILGKTAVLCEDTPAFIANRIGVYALMALIHTAQKLELTVEEVDILTGTIMGRPKSASFRTCDVVGLDTLIAVAQGVIQNAPEDEGKSFLELPEILKYLQSQKFLGDKSGQGFYQKTKNAEGKTEILQFDLKSKTYIPQNKPKLPVIAAAKNSDSLYERLKLLVKDTSKYGAFYRAIFGQLFSYAACRYGEISQNLFAIDQAMKAGFAWELGPFELWDALGFELGKSFIIEQKGKIPSWLTAFESKKLTSFYIDKEGKKAVYQPAKNDYTIIEQEGTLSLNILKKTKTVFENADIALVDLGDGILNLSFHTKMNTIGGGVLDGIHQAVAEAEKNFRGLTLYNEGENFSAGANVGMIFMLAAEEDYVQLEAVVKYFQDSVLALRYAKIPVVAAPHNLALGGGCEVCMHADKIVAHAELYMGLVEFGVGIIPAGGGSKEFALRLSEELKEGDVRLNRFRERFLTIGQAKVSTSAHEAFELGYLRKGIDEIVVSRAHQLQRAKEACMYLAAGGYLPPLKKEKILVLGQEALGIVEVGANSMSAGHYISQHDELISKKLGFVMAGGDLSGLSYVSEEYLLKLERQAFVELCRQPKTLERMQSLLNSGKILRN